MKPQRDPTWRVRRSLGHKVVRDRTKYRRKAKHKKKPPSKNSGASFL
jgi:hypothetical protein